MEYELKDLQDEGIIDAFGRRVEKLRIGVAQTGNLRARFLGAGEEAGEVNEEGELLSFEEIAGAVKIGAALGIHQIKFAGGEPLERAGLGELVQLISNIEGIDEVSLNTYGLKLENQISLLKEKGLHRITFNIDSLAPERYSNLTGGARLQTVLKNLESVMQAGFKNTKVNVLVMKGINDDEIEDFVRLAGRLGIEVRFVEYIPHAGFKKELFIRMDDIFRKVSSCVELEEVERQPGRIARVFRIKNASGTLGFIAPVSDLFCFECTRLRLSASGELVSCLIGGVRIEIKRFLRPAMDRKSIEKALFEAADKKPLKHGLHRLLRQSERPGEEFNYL